MRSSGSKRKALSASSTALWRQCPLKFRLIHIDGLREPPSKMTTRGVLVHAVLEHLYDLPAADRTPDAARELVTTQYRELFTEDEHFLTLFEDETDLREWKDGVRGLVEQYFQIENPQRLQPQARELFVETEIGSGLLARGFIDRLDRAPNGALRVVDYKTGKSPRPQYTEDKLAQMRFYALLLARTDYGMPARTQLVFLADGRILTMDPTAWQINRFEEEISQLWEQIVRAIETNCFVARKQPLCNWCQVSHLCPVQGGSTPTMNEDGAAALLGVERNRVQPES